MGTNPIFQAKVLQRFRKLITLMITKEFSKIMRSNRTITLRNWIKTASR